jgi:AsmA protein
VACFDCGGNRILMSRRVLLLFTALAVLIALAVAPWTISSPGLKDQIRRQLRDGYGLELAASGQTTIALLPMPRLKFTNVTLTADGRPVVEGALLRGELRLIPLIAARLDLTDLSLAGGRLALEIGPDGTTSWDTPIARLSGRAAGEQSTSHLRRLVLARAALAIDDRRTGERADFTDINLVARWPSPGAELGVSGSARWRGDLVSGTVADLVPARLAAGQPSPVRMQLGGHHGDLTITGELALAGEPRLNGQVAASTPSLDAFLAWSGLARTLPGSPLPLAIAGEIALSRNEVALPRDRFVLGSGRLDGAAMMRLDTERRSIRATLAADALDFSDLLGFARRPWRAAPVDLEALRRADLDLRLSASSIALGGVTLTDVATGLLTNADRIEVSLGRASLNDGVVRGRVSLGGRPAEYDVKVQSSFARVDLGALLVSTGMGRAFTGTAQGGVQLEATGDTPDTILRSLAGRFNMSLEDGEIAGIALAEGLRRAEERPAQSNVAARRGGRTTFQQASLNLTLSGGVADISEGTLDSSSLHANVSGKISLAERRMALTARMAPPIDGTGDLPNYVLDVSGPWDGPNIARTAAGAVPAR